MSQDQEILPVRTKLRMDTFLQYLIQQVTGQSSIEILGFFNDFGREVAIIGAEKRKYSSQSIRKDIRDFYPDTCIPFKLLVNGNAREYEYTSEPYVDANGVTKYKQVQTEGKHFAATIEVCFPEATSYYDSRVVDTMLLEKMLLGGDDLPPFPKPDPRTPKMYRDLIAKVCKRDDLIKTKKPKRTKTESRI